MKLNVWTNEQRGRSLGLANALGITPPVVSDWCTGKKGVPLERCAAIERATEGAVTRQDLRPDDWRDIWPELAEAKAEQAQDAISAVTEEAQAVILHVADTAVAEIKHAAEELLASQAAAEPWDGVTERRHADAPTPVLSQAIDTFARAGLIERRLVVRRSASRGRRAGEVD